MHRERAVGIVTTAGRLERGEGTRVLTILMLGLWRMLRLRLFRFQTQLELSDGRAAESGGGQDACLEGAANKTRPVGVEALADDLTTTNDDRTVAVVEGR